MSNSPINHSADLNALVECGYSLEIRGAYLLVKNIPYLRTSNGDLGKADLITSLDLTPEHATRPPGDHTIWWTGDVPYRSDGESMEAYLSCGKWDTGQDLGEGLTVYMQWSRKLMEAGRKRAYTNYQEKIQTYVDEVAGHADARYPGVLEAARAGEDPVVVSDSRFRYLNTATYRYGLRGVERPLEEEVVAVIGVGGTGSYLVDVLAKTNIRELHLFDEDILEQHNAFRLAGAARVEELGGTHTKVAWHKERYSAVRDQGVFANATKVNGASAGFLGKFTTVFIAVDDLDCRRAIQRKCNELSVFHVSVGLAVEIEGEDNNQLGGMVKVETGLIPERRCAADSAAGEAAQQAYGNVQTAELNMLGAALAIVEWKAKAGIYRSERTGYDSVLFSATTGRILHDQRGRGPYR